MKFFHPLVLALALVVIPSTFAAATPAEMRARDEWKHASFGGPAAALPFSFTLDDAASSSFLNSWRRERGERQLDEARTEITVTCTDPNSGLLSTHHVKPKQGSVGSLAIPSP